jgi:hypothetical protein
MKFVKILYPKVPNKKGPATEWRCIISNYSDLHAYANFEGHLISRAFLQLERTSEGRFDAAHARDKKTGALATLLNLRAERLKEGETFRPIIEMSKIHSSKMESMSRILSTGEAICINAAGGFCGLDGFLEQWNASIIETVEKDDQGFPVDNEAMNAVTLILENQDNPNRRFVRIVEERTGTKTEVLANMKEKDNKWVFQSIRNAKTIAFSSTFDDRLQIADFLEAFLHIPRKQVIIGYWNDLDDLTKHPLYEKAAALHNVELVDMSQVF